MLYSVQLESHKSVVNTSQLAPAILIESVDTPLVQQEVFGVSFLGGELRFTNYDEWHSMRQSQVAALGMTGLTDNEAASELYLSPSTIGTYQLRLLRKVYDSQGRNAKSRTLAGLAYSMIHHQPPLAQVTRPAEASFFDTMTNHQLRIVAMVSKGLTNAEIASRLTVATSTAKQHVENIGRKLGTGKRSLIGTAGVLHGIIETDTAV